MAIMQQLLLAISSGLINQVQTVSISIAAGATSGVGTLSTAVDMNTSSEHYSGHNIAQTSFNPATDLCGIALTSSTQVTATRNTSDASNALTVQATVVSWNPAKITSIQRGTITMTGASSNTASLTFTLTNSVVQYNGLTTTYTSNNPNNYYGSVALTASTITANRGGTTNNMTVYYCLIEFASGVLNSSTQQTSTAQTSSLTGTATITAVTTSQTMLVLGGWRYSGGAATADVVRPYVTLTNGTTITTTMSTSGGGTLTTPLGVIEFKSTDINSVNRGSIAMSTAQTSNTASITAVVLSKTIPNYLGNNTTGSGSNNQSAKIATLTLPNTTTPTTARTATASISTVTGWETIEFK